MTAPDPKKLKSGANTDYQIKAHLVKQSKKHSNMYSNALIGLVFSAEMMLGDICGRLYSFLMNFEKEHFGIRQKQEYVKIRRKDESVKNFLFAVTTLALKPNRAYVDAETANANWDANIMKLLASAKEEGEELVGNLEKSFEFVKKYRKIIDLSMDYIDCYDQLNYFDPQQHWNEYDEGVITEDKELFTSRGGLLNFEKMEEFLKTMSVTRGLVQACFEEYMQCRTNRDDNAVQYLKNALLDENTEVERNRAFYARLSIYRGYFLGQGAGPAGVIGFDSVLVAINSTGSPVGTVCLTSGPRLHTMGGIFKTHDHGFVRMEMIVACPIHRMLHASSYGHRFPSSTRAILKWISEEKAGQPARPFIIEVNSNAMKTTWPITLIGVGLEYVIVSEALQGKEDVLEGAWQRKHKDIVERYKSEAKKKGGRYLEYVNDLWW